jgi:hypothetical protein
VSQSLSLPELEQLLQVDKTELDAKKGQIAEKRNAIDAMPQRPAEIRERVTELARLATELETQLGLMNKQATSGSADNIVRTYTVATTPALAALAGLAIAGNWKLLVSDHDAIDVGKLNRWGVVIRRMMAASAGSGTGR